jgi:sporulation protein YlmC with PRC-barrel domain
MYTAFQKTSAIASLLTWTLLANSAHGQLLRQRRVVPAQPAPTDPAANQPTPSQAAPDPQQGPQPNANAQVGGAQADAGRVIRGRNLIGMNIWSANRQQLGTVKDFIVDYQSGDCPTIYFAVAPQIAGWSGDYVIVPLNAFQAGFDARQRTDYFTLNMTTAELGRVPRLAVDKWNSA